MAKAKSTLGKFVEKTKDVAGEIISGAAVGAVAGAADSAIIAIAETKPDAPKAKTNGSKPPAKAAASKTKSEPKKKAASKPTAAKKTTAASKTKK